MVVVSSYILIFASVVVFGYNLSQVIENFGALEEKLSVYRKVLLSYEEPLDKTRRLNAIENVLMLLAYAIFAYLAGFAAWVLVTIVLKFSFSCLISDKMHRLVLGEKLSVPRAFYILHKLDSLLNGLLCIFMLLAFVL